MKIQKYLIYSLSLFLFACNDFLEEKPSKTTSLVPETTGHLESLLNDYSSFYLEENSTASFSSDDFGLYRELYEAQNSVYNISTVEFATWDMEYLPAASRDAFWTTEYKKIFTANMILDYLPEVKGDESTKALLRAEAHLIRAYSMWVLANTYCLPYSDINKQEPGLVLKLSTNFEESMKRASLEKTYDQIEKDLQEALKINVDLTMVNGKYKIWRASLPAVHAFAARYYLFMNNYNEALKYADLALKKHADLVDYNTEMRYSTQKRTVIINGQEVEIKYPHTFDNQNDMNDKLGWKEFYYFRMLNNSFWWYGPSKELLASYDHQYDLRYKYHFVLNYSYDMGVISPAYEWPGYVFFFKDRIPSGPTVAEMILIKAECQAREGDYTAAMNTVNLLRAKRMSNDAPRTVINLSAESPKEAISQILAERRREMPFTMRWFDIRRFNNNDYPDDDVILTKEFYPYTNSSIRGNEPLRTYRLEKQSRRFAQPILTTEIESSRGEIEQNKY